MKKYRGTILAAIGLIMFFAACYLFDSYTQPQEIFRLMLGLTGLSIMWVGLGVRFQDELE